jgi:hypothetical protein
MNNDVVMIHLDRPRQLKFTHSALKTLVALTGKDLEELEGDLKGTNFEMVEKLMYCGLLKDAKDNGETITPEEVVDLMDEAPSFAESIEKVFAAWNIAFGVKKEAEGNSQQPVANPAKEGRSTGKKASE